MQTLCSGRGHRIHSHDSDFLGGDSSDIRNLDPGGSQHHDVCQSRLQKESRYPSAHPEDLIDENLFFCNICIICIDGREKLF